MTELTGSQQLTEFEYPTLLEALSSTPKGRLFLLE